MENKINKDTMFNAKIELWKHINSYINSIENGYSIFFTLIITVLGGIIVYFKGDLKPEKLFDYNFYILCFLPIALSTVIAYLSYNFRWVAIARMYLSALEKEINKELDKNFYTWNSNVIDEFVSKNNFPNTKLLPFVNFSFFASIWFFFIYNMFSSGLELYIKIIYSIFVILLLIVCMMPFLGNDKIRKAEYHFGLHSVTNEASTTECS